MCPLSCPLFENPTLQCGHLYFFGLCFLELNIFPWCSCVSILAYSSIAYPCASVSKNKGSPGANPKLWAKFAWRTSGYIAIASKEEEYSEQHEDCEGGAGGTWGSSSRASSERPGGRISSDPSCALRHTLVLEVPALLPSWLKQ